ncbi:response regulator [Paenibacillus tuaregi]|uniref:response regulator n=1 Tax=Paenibacillus tuaregi TaxID=1816681 RepID=UPI0008398434|nr:response regulator [Paenibacillus tuaregi]
MLRIVIVDDEVLIREGLARMIQKENPEFLITGSCSDGEQVLHDLNLEAVDVVITDIRMPQIGGLELIRKLKDSYPHIRSILMSGFTEFSYAQEAIRYSAVDYLLKPINKDQLFALLYRLDEERKNTRKKEDQQRKGILLSVLLSRASSDFLLSELVLPCPYFTLLAIKMNSSIALTAFKDSLLKMETVMHTDVLELHEHMHILICYSDKEPSYDQLQVMCSAILSSVSSKILVHIGISRSYHLASELYTAYLESIRACGQGIYSESFRYIAHIQDISLPSTNVLQRLTGDKSELIHDLQILNINQIMKRIKEGLVLLKTENSEPESYLRYVGWIRETAANELQEFQMVYESSSDLKQVLSAVMSYTELESEIMDTFLSVFTEIRNKRMLMGGNAVETVKQWISANYNQQADLNELARMVYLTPSYLSKLFKQETGFTLTDYIIDVRINQAKHLLKTAPWMKIHHIGAEIGYDDPAYFNKLFKRIVGLTPNQYRQIARQSHTSPQ